MLLETELLARIDAHLAATAETPSAFGRRAAGDPNLVFDLKQGRSVGLKLRQRINAALTNAESVSTE